MTQIKEFRINEFITLKLEDGETNIYILEELFEQCKYLLLKIPFEDIPQYSEIKSIDEAAEILDRSLEGEELDYYNIPRDTEFWAHCSNLQAWVENNYDTTLLHSNIAFTLLKKLASIGDPTAQRVFKKEITKRFTSGHPSVVWYLWEQGYLDLLDIEEIDLIFENSNTINDCMKGEKFWFKLGDNAFKTKNFSRAFICFKKCVEINPHFKQGWAFLGDSCTFLGGEYFKRGINAYNRAIELNPNCSSNYNGLSFIHSRLKNYKEAIKLCQKSIEINPADYYPYGVLGYMYYKRKRYKRARERYIKAVKLKPSFIVGWSILSEIFIKENNYKEALKCANRALELDPRRYSVYFYKGRSLYKMKKYLDAIDAYQQALLLEEKEKTSYKIKDHLIYGNLTKVYIKLGDQSKAIESYKKCLELDPLTSGNKRTQKILIKIIKYSF